jgi:2-methylcitrate dehydratase PrpD
MGHREDAPTATLATWAASVRSDRIPPRVRQRTAYLLTDAVACALAGRRADETAQFEAVARDIAPGDEATAIAAGRLSRFGATLLNAYQVTAVTVCDVYRPNHCHVTPEVVPPTLAVAEDRGVSGTDLITALAVGLEVTVRIARAIDYSSFRQRGWHSPGVIGGFGGASAAGRILDLDPDEMRWALGLAGSQAAGTFAQWGTPTVKFHQTHGATAGLIAATMARERFRASDEILTHPDGGVFGTYAQGGDPRAAVANLGEEWELERISMRLWPTASLIQGVVSAVFDLIEEHDLRPEDVERMTIGLAESTYRMHAEMGWDDRFRALLSTRYSAAVVLHDRECWLGQFEPARLADPAVGRFAAERIEVVVDPSVPTTGATVEADLSNGRRLAVRRDVPKGDADDPLSADEIVAKFQRSARGVLPDGVAERTLQLLLAIEELQDTDSLMALLAETDPPQ